MNQKDKTKHIKLKQQRRETITVPGKGTYLDIVDLKKLHDMRFNPRISIMASVELALQNLKKLEKRYKPISSLNVANKAKLMYLSHHLGENYCINFIEDTMRDDQWPKNDDGTFQLYKTGKYAGKPIHIIGAETLLRAQFKEGSKEPDELYEREDYNWILAHRRWLITMIDKRVNIQDFACDKSEVPTPDSLFDIITTIGGKHPGGFTIKKS